MFIIEKEFAFEAAHHLTRVPEGHKCGREHGHSYRVRVVLAAERLNEMGFVVDYGDLEPFKRFIDDSLDHRNLNEVLQGEPTAELIAMTFYRWCKSHWPETLRVGVSETQKTWAWYEDVVPPRMFLEA